MIETTSSDPLQYTPENYHDNGNNNHLKIYLLFNMVIPIQHGDSPLSMLCYWEGESLSNTLSTSITSSWPGPVQPDLPRWQPLVHAWLSLKKKLDCGGYPPGNDHVSHPAKKKHIFKNALGKGKSCTWDRHCCLEDFGRSTRHDVWRPNIALAEMREHRVGIHFISCTFQFLLQNPQLRPCQGVQSFLGTVKIGIWCQHYPVSISFWA